MRFEISAYEIAVPLPVVFAIRCGMDADEAAAMVDVILQGLFLFWPKDLAGGAEENERCIFPEDLTAKPGGVGGGIDQEAILLAQFGDGCDARCDARMVVTVGLA